MFVVDMKHEFASEIPGLTINALLLTRDDDGDRYLETPRRQYCE